MYGNGGRMHVTLNGEPLEEVDFLSTWCSKLQLMEDVKGMWYGERCKVCGAIED